MAFIIVLIAATPEPNYDALILLPLLGAFQILEPRLKLFSSRGGQIVSILLKLLLSYLLIGYSHGLDSYYASIFLIPDRLGRDYISVQRRHCGHCHRLPRLLLVPVPVPV